MEARVKLERLRRFRARAYDWALYTTILSTLLSSIAIFAMSASGRIGHADYFALGAVVLTTVAVLSFLAFAIAHIILRRFIKTLNDRALARASDVASGDVLGKPDSVL